MNHKLFLREVALSAAEPARLNVLANLKEIGVNVIVNVIVKLKVPSYLAVIVSSVEHTSNKLPPINVILRHNQ